MFLLELLQNKEVYIWGAGQRGVILHYIFEERGIDINAFIDGDEEKHGTLICNTKCFGINDITLGNNCYVIISPTGDTTSIFEQLQKKGIDSKNIYTMDMIEQEHYFCPMIEEQSDFKYVHPFNHYESPYPDIREIHKKEAEIFDSNKEVLDVDFNIPRQFELLEIMTDIDNPPWSKQKTLKYRFYYDNCWFGKGSVDVLYYMMRILKPKRIIEVGSGFSTAAMLDANDKYFEKRIEINSIEPNADRLKSLLRNDDNIKIQECVLQDISLEFFEQLQENDILFIDSSHVSRVDSDVNYILFEILPRLKKGVYIHFHDVTYPFEYPSCWIYEGRAYNEMYILRAFLMNNKKFSIQFFGDMLMKKYPDKLNEKVNSIAGSIWLRKE